MLFKDSGDLITRFNSAKEAGFKAVECTFPYTEATPEELKAVIEKTGLQHVLVNSYPGRSRVYSNCRDHKRKGHIILCNPRN